MSVDWFIHKFKDEIPIEFEASKISAAFEGIKRTESLSEATIWWDLECGSSMTAGKEGSDSVESILINRPAIDSTLLEALFDLLREEGMILFSADLDQPFTANLQTRKHLPEDMIESLGEPTMLESSKHFKTKV